ncbi:hypothetical protein O6H91_18G057000 [Diphasiastrum complanatum]|uniref:Uncharacterized protein n=1 Tax=Diphasiastrum complanatum TaxID=34168 RepID=A0ACC2B1F9_DIPCM|nr:hypothetical protein O6H91_18G057000 [Diphasiastrum complanatum]
MGEGGNELLETPVKDSNIESKTLPDEQEKRDSWRLIEPQPLREEQVQNAVKFLAHPKVKGSPIVYRRSFLERKGLTKEEIDEAFRRVPDPPSEAGNTVASAQGELFTTPSTSKVSAPLPAPQHSAQVVVPDNHVQPSRFRWTQMVLAIGVLTTAGAGATVLAKNYILPKFKAWLRHIVLEDHDSEAKPTEPGPVKEIVSAAAAAAAAASAASDMAAVTREVLSRRSEDQQCFENMMKAVEAQTQELKLTLSSMRESVLSIEKSTSLSAALNHPVHGSGLSGDANASYKSLDSLQQVAEEQVLQNGGVPVSVLHQSDNNGLVRPSSAPPGGAPSNAPHSASYMEIVAMLQRGEKPPNIQDVNDKPPNPNQPPSNPKLQPRPWEKLGNYPAVPLSTPISKVLDSAAMKPASDNENRTPINKFGNDSEKSAVFVETVASSSSSNPWWLHKKSEQEHVDTGSNWLTESTVKITELEPQREANIDGVDKAQNPLAQPSSSSPTVSIIASQGRQGWVPPPVPQTILPGAAAAIRHQKVLVNGYESKPSPTSRIGAVLGQSSSSSFESEPMLSLSTADGTQSDAQQVAPTATLEEGQDLNVIDESILEKPSYKDVVVEGRVSSHIDI